MLILYFLLFVIRGLLNSNSKLKNFAEGYAATILSTIFNINVEFLSTLIPICYTNVVFFTTLL